MNKFGSIIVIVLSLIAGFGGGLTSRFVFNQTESDTTKTISPTQSDSSPSTETTASTKKQTLEECLTEVWGADKYAAISANSNLATTEDNLASLKCYKK